ncbi:MAG: hypothetical protein KGJ06_01895, partial [Pseudomonadota bacterium]|nr:hypothetical protein [Pseudomonadota bacterium]
GPAKGVGNDFSYAIVSDTSGVSINGRPVNDITAMYNEYVGSVLKADAASAQPATPVPTTPAKR